MFKETYKKSDSQNLKDLLDLFENLRIYIKPEKYDELVSYVKKMMSQKILYRLFLKSYY